MIKLINILKEILNNKILIPRHSPEERQQDYLAKDIKKIEKYIKNGSKGNLSLSQTKIKHLPKELKIVKGDLNLQESLIESLPDNLIIKGELNLSYTNNIESLPKNLKIEEDLWLGNKINHLPKDIEVGGNVRFSSYFDIEKTPLNRKDYPGVKGNIIVKGIYLTENVKLGKQYVSQGKLSEDDLKTLIEIDPTPTRKFVGWMAKIWINEKPDLNDLRNTIKEYNTFLNKDKVKTKDINQFKTFKDLQSEVNELNQSGKGKSSKDKEYEYETIIDTSNLLIMSPRTHEASRKLGLTYFAFRDCKGGQKDSAWCTTYKAPDHFDDYYYENNATFYYIKVKSPKMIDELKNTFPGSHFKNSKLEKYKAMEVVALVILPNKPNSSIEDFDDDQIKGNVYDGNLIDGYDGLDQQISAKDIRKFISIIGIS
jgi:hypothetical protein